MPATAALVRPFTTVALSLAAGLALAACGGGAGSTGASSDVGGGSGSGSTPGHTRRYVPALIPPANPQARSVHVPILTYHRVHQYATEPVKSVPDLTVEPSVFYSEMKALVNGGYHSVTIRELFNAVFHGASLPSKPVLIAVDDGYVDDVRSILPILRRFGLKASFFVITGRANQAGFLNPSQMRELDRAGMDVEDHTMSHVDLRTQSSTALAAQVAGSKRTLEGFLGHPVSAFAYPFGTFNQGVLDEVRRAGYALAFTTQGGNAASSLAPLTIPRIHVGRNETASGLLSLISSGGAAASPATTG